MRHDWIVDVLTDLRNYASKQAMFELAEQLDDAMVIAAGEASQTGISQECSPHAPTGMGNISRPVTPVSDS